MVFFVIMGVCGSGKSTVALELSRRLKCPVFDADDFHPAENKEKMSKSIPLTDEDRYPWLMAIHEHINRELANGNCGIIACSALKKIYRQILLRGGLNEPSDFKLALELVFIYLKGSQQLITQRLTNRTGHFMPVNLLQSQFDVLEEPDVSENCIAVDIDQKPSEIVMSLVSDLVKRFPTLPK